MAAAGQVDTWSLITRQKALKALKTSNLIPPTQKAVHQPRSNSPGQFVRTMGRLLFNISFTGNRQISGLNCQKQMTRPWNVIHIGSSLIFMFSYSLRTNSCRNCFDQSNSNGPTTHNKCHSISNHQ